MCLQQTQTSDWQKRMLAMKYDPKNWITPSACVRIEGIAHCRRHWKEDCWSLLTIRLGRDALARRAGPRLLGRTISQQRVVEGKKVLSLPNIDCHRIQRRLQSSNYTDNSENFPVAARLPESFAIFDSYANREPRHSYDRTSSACGSMN